MQFDSSASNLSQLPAACTVVTAMKFETLSVTIGTHPADRILAIFRKLQQDFADREAAIRIQARKDALAEVQTKLDEAYATIARLQEQAGAAAANWQADRAELHEQVAILKRDAQVRRTLTLQFNAETPFQDCNGTPRREGLEARSQEEMARVQLLIEEINRKLADPSVGLSSEIRLNRERSEYECYLRGLRFLECVGTLC